MYDLTPETMAKAIERAKASRMKVKVLSVAERRYAVTNGDGKTYNVRFAVANGHRLGACDCPARTVCKHIASAAALNIAVQSQRELNPTKADMARFMAMNTGWMV